MSSKVSKKKLRFARLEPFMQKNQIPNLQCHRSKRIKTFLIKKIFFWVYLQLCRTAVQGGDRPRQERRICAGYENSGGQVYQHVECGTDHGRLVACTVQLGRKVCLILHLDSTSCSLRSSSVITVNIGTVSSSELFHAADHVFLWYSLVAKVLLSSVNLERSPLSVLFYQYQQQERCRHRLLSSIAVDGDYDDWY